MSSRLLGPASMVILAVTVGLAATKTSIASSFPAPRWVLHGSYSPMIDPANFVPTIDNQYFPLKPGTAFYYRGHGDETAQTDDMVVTHRTKKVLGVTCTVVRDVVSEHGKPLELTFDWYAQDTAGNVWYMGEDSRELKNGRFVRASDSWQSGINGAKPGIIMEAEPNPGDVYRQEYYPPGRALDQARVLQETPTVTVPAGTYKGALSTIEYSPVEPQLEKKLYAAGVGEIQEQVVRGGHERFQLVRVTQ
jgi:hypothetical protein